MRIFLTGGSGFLGGHLAESLSKAHTVLALARSERAAAAVARWGAEPVHGELGKVDPAALAGVDVVIHAAAFAEEWGTREQFWQGNVEGTAQLLVAARAAGVPRFVHISSEAVLFTGKDLRDVDESHPLPTRHRFLYAESKAEAERLVVAANDASFTTITLRPRLIWGPRDATVLPAIRRMAEAGAFWWLDAGAAATSTTHVANVVHGVTLALTRGRGGEVYFLADAERGTYRAFLGALARATGFTLPTRSLPGALARPAAALLEGTWRLLGRTGKPPMTHFAVAMTSRAVTVRTDKAARELGYAPVITVEAGLAGLAAG